MAKYYITLNGNQAFFDNLTLIEFEDFKIQDDHLSDFSKYIFVPSILDDENDVSQICGKSNFLLKILEGIFYLLNNKKENSNIKLNLNSINLFNWEEEKLIIDIEKNFKNFLVRIENKNNNFSFKIAEELKNNNLFLYYYYISKHDKSIENLMLLFAYNLDYIYLYNVYDCLKTIIKKKRFNQFCKINGFSEKDIKRFTATANNYGVIGINSRHGNMNYKLPQATMNIDEAKNMFIKLTNYCLENYLNYRN